MRFTVIHRAENLSFTHTIFLSILYSEQATNITYTLEDVEETLRSIKRLWYSLTDQSEGICRSALPFEIILYNYSGKNCWREELKQLCPLCMQRFVLKNQPRRKSNRHSTDWQHIRVGCWWSSHDWTLLSVWPKQNKMYISIIFNIWFYRIVNKTELKAALKRKCNKVCNRVDMRYFFITKCK